MSLAENNRRSLREYVNSETGGTGDPSWQVEVNNRLDEIEGTLRIIQQEGLSMMVSIPDTIVLNALSISTGGWGSVSTPITGTLKSVFAVPTVSTSIEQINLRITTKTGSVTEHSYNVAGKDPVVVVSLPVQLDDYISLQALPITAEAEFINWSVVVQSLENVYPVQASDGG